MEDSQNTQHYLTATEAGLSGCRTCGSVAPSGSQVCPHCRSRLEFSETASLQRVWAWLTAGLIAYVPANIYPMLRTKTFGGASIDYALTGLSRAQLDVSESEGALASRSK